MTSSVESIYPACAPKPIGPYAPLVRAGDWIFGSAIAAFDPVSGTIVGANAFDQTLQILTVIEAMLLELGVSLTGVASVTVYLLNMEDFAEMNRAYEAKMGSHRPARSVVEVSGLPKDGALLTMSFTAFSG